MIPQKKADVLKAALCLVSKHGFHGTSMAMIADEAHCGAGTIYNYFPSKDQLMDDLFRALETEFIETIAANVASKSSFRLQFLTLWKNIIVYALSNPEKVAYLQQYHYSPYYNDKTAEFIEEAYAPLETLFKAAIDAHEIQSMPLAVYEAFTSGVALYLAQCQNKGRIFITEEILRQTALACWHAIEA